MSCEPSVSVEPPEALATDPPPRRRVSLAAPVRWLLLLGVGAALLLGSPVARFVAVAAGVFALLGEWDGAIRHAFRWVALGALFVVVPWAAGPLGDQLSTRLSMSAQAGLAIGAVLVTVLTFVIVGAIGAGLSRWCRREHVGREMDRLVGLLLGAGEGGLAAVAVVWVLAMFAAPLERVQQRRASHPDLPAAPWLETMQRAAAAVKADPAGAYLAENNPLSDAPVIGAAARMANVLSDPQKFSRVMKASELREFGELPAIKRHIDAIQSDPELRRAAEERNLGVLLSSRAFLDMLSDPQVHAALEERFAELQRAVEQADAGVP